MLKALECENFREVLSNNVIIIGANGNKYGNYITFSCEVGYNINNGSSTRICLKNGKWSGKSPTCSLVYCGLPKNGKNSYWEFGVTGTIANYFCNKGFKESEGNKTRICTVDSTDHTIKWMGAPLECVELSCEKFNLTNATAEITSYKIGSFAYLECKSGYRAVGGNYIRTCSEYGTWTGQELICHCKIKLLYCISYLL